MAPVKQYLGNYCNCKYQLALRSVSLRRASSPRGRQNHRGALRTWGFGQTCWRERDCACCLRSRCCCCSCCRSFIWSNCCWGVIAWREGGCIMVPERRCSMFDRACFVLVGTKEPVGSSLEPPENHPKHKCVLCLPYERCWYRSLLIHQLLLG